MQPIRTPAALFQPSVRTRLAQLRSGRLGRALRTVSAGGWTLLGMAVVLGVVSRLTAWEELAYPAVAFATLFAGACLLTVGRPDVSVALALEPRRIRVGETALARMTITNAGRRPQLSALVRLPIGDTIGRFPLPVLNAGATHTEQVIVGTTRRGVTLVGPAITQRGDPFGLVQRDLTTTAPVELLVLPRTVPIDLIGAGVLRDLEGQTSDAVSMSDLAFHTLRDYRPGDDSRHIHWPSSEKLAGRRGMDGQDRIDDEEFLVRQFLDTNRAHVAVAVDCHPVSFADEDEFELAVAVAASIAARAAHDGMNLTVVSGPVAAVQVAASEALDVFARMAIGPTLLAVVTPQVLRLSPGISCGVVVSGSGLPLGPLLGAAAPLAHAATTVVLRVQAGARPAVRRYEQLTVLTVGGLDDLAPALRAAVAA